MTTITKTQNVTFLGVLCVGSENISVAFVFSDLKCNNGPVNFFYRSFEHDYKTFLFFLENLPGKLVLKMVNNMNFIGNIYICIIYV